MHGRAPVLILLVGLLSILVNLLVAGNAWGHHLDAQSFLLSEHKIQIEGWFSSGDAAKGAQVQVFRPEGQLLVEGQLNEEGVFIFSYEEAEPLRVVISAGAGHRKELTINPGTSAPHDSPLAERHSPSTAKDIVVAVGFLLAAAAFFLSLRNSRQLRQLMQKAKDRADSTREMEKE